MTQNVPPPIPTLVPETAPFSRRAARLAERLLRRPRLARPRRRHRAVAGAERGADAVRATGPPTTATTARRPGTTRRLPLAERMKLAEGRPLRRRMMAAMAQQDCGQCGYNCEDYSERAVPARKKSG